MRKIDIATKFKVVWLIESFLSICLIFLYYDAIAQHLYQACSDRLFFHLTAN
ncbi:hypothetical protein [Nostoc sp. UHCC 0252]|uniref:hypothetical protein n=1 Tax=Nostoc sp. UHCC 0252 TaxID=3110241 RepID=UPI002B21AA26|nr:hypothetical protein [Nostoc sp. UHCC 0252]MEA5604797.1 hypothetical protein [Nostoc sp. UHCC 0252]